MRNKLPFHVEEHKEKEQRRRRLWLLLVDGRTDRQTESAAVDAVLVARAVELREAVQADGIVLIDTFRV